ncbi:MAG: hypothetical protein HKN23_10960 [Verrucomicrobiales bacterium]|nr:hypothetical protein [Verrucomicrobiales bacterium]
MRTHWVIALKPEADAVIDRFGLKRIRNEQAGFPIWHSEETGHWLVLSGIGKANAAAATAWLQAVSGEPDEAVLWLNFGIAGHRNREIGSLIRAHKITDSATGKSWFPPAVWDRKHDIESGELLTVDLPTADYPELELVDMEASGFLGTATRFETAERVQVLKIVSDNVSGGGFEKVDAEKVRGWTSAVIPAVAEWHGEVARKVS